MLCMYVWGPHVQELSSCPLTHGLRPKAPCIAAAWRCWKGLSCPLSSQCASPQHHWPVLHDVSLPTDYFSHVFPLNPPSSFSSKEPAIHQAPVSPHRHKQCGREITMYQKDTEMIKKNTALPHDNSFIVSSVNNKTNHLTEGKHILEWD